MALRVDDVDLARDRTLVERAQAGDGAAFAELYARYFARLCRFCERRVGDAHEAEEVAQEAFTRACRALPGLAGERRFYPWLSVIAARLCVDVHRRRARSRPTPAVDAGWVDGGQEDVLRAVDTALVRTALAQLSPRHQEILRLREWEDWSYERLAEHLDMTMAGIEALLWRARQALRREVERLDYRSGRWAALPVVAWLVRRLAGARRALATAVESPLAPVVSGAVSAAVVGALALGVAAGSSGPSRPLPTIGVRSAAPAGSHEATVSPDRLPTAPPAPLPHAPAPLAPTPAPTPAPSSASGAAPSAYHPVRNSSLGGYGSAGPGEESRQPVQSSAAGTAVGVDPGKPATDLNADVQHVLGRSIP
ncbi:MAG TPA: sigma-70 family RNA polymerase sigma factor [Acidimicrobiales bacterium]